MAISFSRSWNDGELELYRDTVVRFLETEVCPGDEVARKNGHVGRDIWRRVGSLGLLCGDLPTEFGGGGGDFRHDAVLYEELARKGLTGFAVSVHNIVAHYLLNHGTANQKALYLPQMARGELIGAIAMTEPSAGSDLRGIRTRATRNGESFQINGTKTFISNGYLAELMLVVAQTGEHPSDKSLSIFIVETRGCEGFSVGKLLDKIGMKAQDTAELFFDAVEVPLDGVLGGVAGQGMHQLMSDLPYERLIIAVTAVAAMEGAYDATLAYVREREAFGQQIAQFQHTRFKLAEIATNIKAARAFVDRAIEDFMMGQLDTVGASMVKLWASDLQNRVIDDCLQFFGGYGYMNEYLIGRMYTDARIQRIYGGTNEIMKEVISRAL